ncbi:MAG: YqcI/YcgG family protein [Flavobacterium sp.]|nr:YqcI/YcgG family protein [Flavobacterium sp.]
MNTHYIQQEWFKHIDNKEFPCVAAKAALNKDQQRIFVAPHLACPRHDRQILDFIYSFIDDYRKADSLFHSAVIIFAQPSIHSEKTYANLFWQRLQAISDLDANDHDYDTRVSDDPESADFSFSLKGEAFFVVGLNPASSRSARRFKYPAIVFNPHQQFEQLRANGQYAKMQNIIRKKDIALDGAINPMLRDFGTASEVFQYTGQELPSEWKCPLHIQHGKSEHNQSA